MNALRYLLVLALVPVLVLAGPASQAAEATGATIARGSVVSVKIRDFNKFKPGFTTDCDLGGYTRLNDRGLYSVRVSFICNYGAFVRQNDRVIITAFGPGDGCQFSVDVEAPEDTVNDTVLTTLRYDGTGAANPDCELTSGRVQFTGGQAACPAGYEYDEQSGCLGWTTDFQWGLGPLPVAPAVEPEESEASCSLFVIKKRPRLLAELQQYTVPSSGQYYAGTKQNYVRVRSPLLEWYQPPVPHTYMTLILTAVYKDAAGQMKEWTTTAPTSGGQIIQWDAGGNPAFEGHIGLNQTAYARHPDVLPPVIGFSSYDYPAPGAEPGWVFQGVSLRVTSYSGGSTYPPANQANNATGYTNPSVCRFYWGNKIVDDVGTEQDEPISLMPLGEAPDAPAPIDESEPLNPSPVGPDGQPVAPVDSDEGTCGGFSFTDPSTWAGAGICQLVRLIAGLVDAVASIAKAIGGLVVALLEGIGSMLSGLFVPSAGFFADTVTQLGDSWADTPPGAVVGMFSDVSQSFDVQATGGCAGPSMDLDMPMMDESLSLEPLQACTGLGSDVAPIVKIALRVTLYLGAFLLALRVIAAAMGLNLTIGGRGDN